MQRPTANIEWKDGIPYHKDFDDIYFNANDGLAETEYVFIEANRLKERLRNATNDQDTLRVCETGFGSGLNFIASYALWRSLPEPKKRLEFSSIEGFPLSISDLKLASKIWPELGFEYKELLNQYPSPITGFHYLEFESGRVSLKLFFEELNNALDKYQFFSDVWFLDGFAPSKNEEMWNSKLFDHMALYSNHQTTVSTFTAAGFVRRNLIDAGFIVSKISGFKQKREMITASRHLESTTKTQALPDQAWHISENSSPNIKHGHVLVIGAGIAGLTTAITLARKGFKATIIEKQEGPLQGASGQKQLIMYGKFPQQYTPEARLLIQAQLYAQTFFSREQLSSGNRFWHTCGVVHLAWNEKERAKQQNVVDRFELPETFMYQADANKLKDLSGLDIQDSGLVFPQAGWLDTEAFSKHVLEHDNIELINKREYTHQDWESDALLNSMNADATIICNAVSYQDLDINYPLPIKPLRGQTTQLSSKSFATPKTVLCGEGYLCPTLHGELHIGASYDLNNSEPFESREDDHANIEKLVTWLKGWSDQATLNEQVSGRHAGIRTTSNDYTPIVGKLPRTSAMNKQYSFLTKNAKQETIQGRYYDHTYLNLAYGSKGLTYSPLSARLLVDTISSSSIGLPHEQAKQLSPARFLIKSLKKGHFYSTN
ncbi:MAG: bifunctional tRNA (5-methylaminomethyl-2-thiouridine)(34)-methyltransferase MnmD/FAD-dependent 5-carboxymethylaminomethyl-2-thiouridine(34) oxidoreductase MnmC [Oleiphilaceae bacterium]|nr:bifunctional tRNA (5-methylaminomethyl-2-thiouridine)(34)-methyltransferase MnmD/FAD-dependent 5-carboxymethylaminomethyl-2-thiouridine(34) oxidoreductase MnmC [Oleiphilaceae bacterium]